MQHGIDGWYAFFFSAKSVFCLELWSKPFIRIWDLYGKNLDDFVGDLRRISGAAHGPGWWLLRVEGVEQVSGNDTGQYCSLREWKMIRIPSQMSHSPLA